MCSLYIPLCQIRIICFLFCLCKLYSQNCYILFTFIHSNDTIKNSYLNLCWLSPFICVMFMLCLFMTHSSTTHKNYIYNIESTTLYLLRNKPLCSIICLGLLSLTTAGKINFCENNYFPKRGNDWRMLCVYLWNVELCCLSKLTWVYYIFMERRIYKHSNWAELLHIIRVFDGILKRGILILMAVVNARFVSIDTKLLYSDRLARWQAGPLKH